MEDYAEQYANDKVEEALKNRPCPECGKKVDCPKPPPPEQLPCKPVEEPSTSSRTGRGRGFGGKKAAATNCARDCPCSDRDDCIAESECSARRDAQVQQACSSELRLNGSEVSLGVAPGWWYESSAPGLLIFVVDNMIRRRIVSCWR